MKDIGMAIQGAILLGGVFGLLAIVVGVFASETIRSWRIWRSKRNQVVMTLVALAAIYVGGTKPMGHLIRWDTGLHDDGSVMSTNDYRLITVKWTYDSWIPNQATFTLRAIPNTVNPDPSVDRMFEVASVPITNRTLTALMETDATNYLFYAEQSFIPDVPVVTNGVYHLRCVGGNDIWVPIGAKIYGDGYELPHNITARDYVQEGLVAMWDGIENAGWGVHDANATTWKNLIGSGDAINQTSLRLNWSDNALVFQDNQYLKVDSLFNRPQQITIEVCHNAKGVAGKRYAALFSSIEVGGVGIQQKAAESTWRFQCGKPLGGYYGALDVSDFEDTASTLVGRVGDYMSTFKNGAENKIGTEIAGIRYNYQYYQIGRDTEDAGNIVGPIYCIRFYNRALSADEIAYNYEIDKLRFNLK